MNLAIASIVPAFDVAHEESDVGSRQERLAAARDDDSFHRGIPRRGVERVLQLRDDVLVERVHRVWTIDGQRGDTVFNLRTNEGEAERLAGAGLAFERGRDGQAPARGKSGDEIAGALDAVVVHQLERAAAPAEAHAGADVGVFDRADAFVDERGRDVARSGGQPVADGLELPRVRSSR